MHTQRFLSAIVPIAATLVLFGTPLMAQSFSPSTPPVTEITLFTSGVAEFIHRGQPDADGLLTLPIPATEMSDVLRSITVLDSEGRAVEAIAFPAADSFNVERLTSLTTVLALFRGERVRVATGGARASEQAGTIVAVDAQTLTTLEGGTLRATRLEDITAVELVDPQVQARFAEALGRAGGVSDGDGSQDVRTVTIQLGAGTSDTVTVRYLRAMPVWKVSYRAITARDTVLVQGWAHIDNVSGIDWNAVRLHLVSSAPETRYLDIYPPRYVRRERIEEPGDRAVAVRPSAAPMAESRAMADQFGEFAPTAPVAQGEQALTGVRLSLAESVTLATGQSMMVPIVAERMRGSVRRVFVAGSPNGNPRISATFTNQSDQQLPAGLFTVYDADRYVGDALSEIIPPGGTATLTYATDTSTRVTRTEQREAEETSMVRVVDGMVVTERRARRTTVYTADAAGASRADAALYTEHVVRSGWEIVSPEPHSRKDMIATFALGDRPLEVVEEQIRSTRYALTSMDTTLLLQFTSNRLLDPRTRRILENVAALREQLATAASARNALEAEEQRITADQGRIRANMGALQPESGLYRRYEGDLRRLEDQLSLVREDVADARALEATARAALEEYVRSL